MHHGMHHTQLFTWPWVVLHDSRMVQAVRGLLEDRVARGTASAVSEDEFDSLFEEEIN